MQKVKERNVKTHVNKADYRFGITKSHWDENGIHRKRATCICGHHTMGDTYDKHFECTHCGNDYFISVPHNQKRFTIPYMEAKYRTVNGFKVRRTNLSVLFENDEITPIKENLNWTIEFDIVQRFLRLWREDVLMLDYPADGTRPSGHRMTDLNARFFTKLDQRAFLEFASTDVNRDLLFVARHYIKEHKRKENLLKGLIQLMHPDLVHLQILSNAGIPQVGRFKSIGVYNYKTKEYVDDIIHKHKTKPHQILNVPKFVIPYLREDLSVSRDILKSLQTSLKKVDHGKFSEIMSIVKDEGTMQDLSIALPIMLELHENEGYSNLKKLTLYLFREVKMMQGIPSAYDASILLRDYIRMSKDLGVEHEKYSRNLKKDHDITLMNYNIILKDSKIGEDFKAVALSDSYMQLTYLKKGAPYAMLIPQMAEDIIAEGSSLSHCVSSYVKDVVKGTCRIVFMRHMTNLEKPLVTIEIRGKNVRQAKGYGNRTVTPDQREFIKEWAEEKGLIESYY